uniref:Uncharacterized protein n=1 Tax=Anguilla anguilla TaxID=7936 RepID=A0A0E9T3F5_ANGAN
MFLILFVFCAAGYRPLPTIWAIQPKLCGSHTT